MAANHPVRVPFATLADIVSPGRLEAYRRPGDNDFDTVTRYIWNIHLCEALYPSIQNLEIGLRNALHRAANKSFNDPLWFRGRVFRASELAQVTEAEAELRRRGKLIEPSGIVAELNFGYWTSLFDSHYDRVLINRPGFLREAFRPMPRRLQTRSVLSKRFNSIRNLRNRVFHHERIIHRNLGQDHLEIMEAIGWINPTLREITQMVDRFSRINDPAFYTALREKLTL